MLKQRPQLLAWEASEAAFDPAPSEASLTSRGSHSIAVPGFRPRVGNSHPLPTPRPSPAASAYPHATANDCTRREEPSLE